MTTMNIFEFLYPKFVINKPIRLIETFAGIGAQAKALENLGVDFEHWKVIEFDKYPVASYNAIHGTNFKPTDIRDVHAADLDMRERERYCYILTYSFPCQDLSVAGRMRGMSKGNGTRSGLLWEVERILDECGTELPHVLLMENVPQVIGERNIKDFIQWRDKLETLGYQNYVDVLNSKDYGVPQNRARCFMVSILGEYSYTFPKKIPLEKKLKDVLEEHVDKKYYLSEEKIRSLERQSMREHKPTLLERERELTLSPPHTDTSDCGNNTLWTVGNTSRTDFARSNVYHPNGISPTLMARDYKGPVQIAVERERERERNCHPGENQEGIPNSK